MPENISFVVDLSEVRASVALGQDPTTYHDWDYLNTNVSLPALQRLKVRLDQGTAEPLTSGEKKKFETDLFKVLEDWARRNPGYGIKEAYDKYSKTKNSAAKEEFINHCAAIKTKHGDEWTHNQVEKVAAVALRALVNDKSPEHIKTSLDDAMQSYIFACREQARKDFDRNQTVFDNGVTPPSTITEGNSTEPYKTFTRENYPSLTGEQIGFITTLYDQGKFVGSALPVMKTLMDKGTIVAVQDNAHIPTNRILQRDGKTYIIRTDDLVARNMDNPNELTPIGTMSTIIDITDLKGEHFMPGCASEKVPIRMIFTGDKKKLVELNIPQKWQSTVREQDISIVDPYHAIAKKLDKYLQKNLHSSAKLNTESKNKLRQGCIDIMQQLVKDNPAAQKEIEKCAGSIIRGYADKQGFKLTVRERINLIKDKIKNHFSTKSQDQSPARHLQEVLMKHTTRSAERSSIAAMHSNVLGH